MNHHKKNSHGLTLKASWKLVLPPAIGLIFTAIIFLLLLITGSNEIQDNLCQNNTFQNSEIILQPFEKTVPIKGTASKAETPDFVYRWLLQSHREHKKY